MDPPCDSQGGTAPPARPAVLVLADGELPVSAVITSRSGVLSGAASLAPPAETARIPLKTTSLADAELLARFLEAKQVHGHLVSPQHYSRQG